MCLIHKSLTQSLTTPDREDYLLKPGNSSCVVGGTRNSVTEVESH